MDKILSYVATHRKAIGSAVVMLAGYLAVEGIPEGFTDWMLLIVFVGGAFGVPAAIRNVQPDVLVRLEGTRLVAGDGAPQETGATLSPYTPLSDVVPHT
jgi:hypothetical protein